MVTIEAEALHEIAAEIDVAASWTTGARAAKLRALADRVRSHAGDTPTGVDDAAGAGQVDPLVPPPGQPGGNEGSDPPPF